MQVIAGKEDRKFSCQTGRFSDTFTRPLASNHDGQKRTRRRYRRARSARYCRVYLKMVCGHLVLRLRRGAATLRTNGSFPYDFPCPLTLSVALAESKGRKAMHGFNVDAALRFRAYVFRVYESLVV
jgi:hypothetical protein